MIICYFWNQLGKGHFMFSNPAIPVVKLSEKHSYFFNTNKTVKYFLLKHSCLLFLVQDI